MNERREFQRLRLDPPLPGSIASHDVSILEIGVLGARVLHTEPLADERVEIRFAWKGHDVGLRCEVVRTVDVSEQTQGVGGNLESGMRFTAAIGDSGGALREMLAELVIREIEARRSAPRVPLPKAIDGDKTVRGRDAAYTCYVFDGEIWKRRRVFLPEQPANGFTLARGEDSQEIQRLCEVYRASDEEGRRLIRMFAELSVSAAMQIPPRA
ncbi:MAG TPA: hypothetical protein VEZ11_06945 [Thermoanaerobaculia bacterium]|nr:hypothetical protein [Thermoanaerobaculia bacterium]